MFSVAKPSPKEEKRKIAYAENSRKRGPSALEWFCTSFFGCLQNQVSVLMVKVLGLQKNAPFKARVTKNQ